jgi:ankyrin repeat protein
VENFVIKNIEYAYQIDHEYRTTLIYAVQNSHIKIVKYLIDVGINIDAKALNGFTAIYYALIKNNYKMVECLLKAGASPWST